MDTRVLLLAHLKRRGPASVRELSEALDVSENAVRHHLAALGREGYLSEALERDGVGRPAKRYWLTLAAEGLFPKRYHELLEAVLTQAESLGDLDALVAGVAARLADQVRGGLPGGDPRARLRALMEHLDYGDMLGALQATEGGWEFKAYNCVYRDIGCSFEPVCDLLPRIVTLATDLPAERVVCQRDGKRYCHFAGSYDGD